MTPFNLSLVLAFGLGFIIPSLAQSELPSWNDTAPKKAIVAFVEKVTKPGVADFVPPAERIAVFDNDGCLWAEQPMYFQAFFIFDRIKALAPEHPEWKEKEPFASVLKGDFKCSSGPHPAKDRASASLFTTPMRSESLPTIVNRISASSTKASTKVLRSAGPSSA